MFNRYVSKNTQLFLIMSAIFLALIAQIIDVPSTGILVSMTGVFFTYHLVSVSWVKWLAKALIFVSSIVLFLHLISGINNPLIVENVQISIDAVPYTKYLNFDKLFLGSLLMSFVLVGGNKLAWAGHKEWLLFAGICLTAFVFAYSTSLVTVDIKLPQILPIWVITNLLFTCVAEEAFFRGFIQKQCLTVFDSFTSRAWPSVVLSGLLFGLVHFPAGAVYVFIATILGTFYAWVYQRTYNIWLPIFMHFFFNLIHILFFTYPFLA